MNDLVMETKNIIKRFPGVLALDDVSINVKKGEIHGLIGENGAGKSTLLKVINGIYATDSYGGEIFINGERTEFKSPHEALVKGIGFVPQEINVMDDLTVAENIFVGHINQKGRFLVNMSDLKQRTVKFLADNKINLDADAKVKSLSVGRKQLLMVARALSWKPSIVILDEPTTALSKADIDNLFEIIINMKKNGKSIIFVTHKLDEIFKITDRVTILRDGKVIDTLERGNYNEKTIIKGMVGRELSQMFPARQSQIGDEVLKVCNLTVEHPQIYDKNIIENVSFSLRRGEILGLIGLVGSGRTETVTTIFGGYPGYSGDIYIEGKKQRIKDEAHAISFGLNMLTEDRKENGLLLLNDIKFNIVISNLKKIRKKVLLNKTKEIKSTNRFIEKLRIKAPSHATMVVNLSGGNQQKVVLAKALHSSPKILILDEPTKGVDVGAKQEIYEIINELLADGISIIMISSELPEMLGMCDRFVVLANGRVVAEAEKEGATQESLMSSCFA